MRFGGFEINGPFPDLNAPHALVTLRPWIDVGAAGTLVQTRLETLFKARELGKLARPGNFFDFTRYRPIMQIKEGVRAVSIPNSTISYARREAGNDLVFVHLLEPHSLSEVYVSSVWQVLKRLGIRRYCLIGGMSDMVPHTRPLMISGGISNEDTARSLEALEVYQSNYQGPTTICHLISQQAEKAGIEAMTLLVHLPQYTEFEEDYTGMVALSRVLGFLYNIPVDEADIQKAANQSRSVDVALQNNSKLKAIVTELETHYDSQAASRGKAGMPALSPEVEKFLKEIEERFKDN
jgi:hypothetical protein